MEQAAGTAGSGETVRAPLNYLADDGEKPVFYPSVAGAAHVVVFDHTPRADSADVREEKRMRDPARSVHNDYTLTPPPNCPTMWDHLTAPNSPKEQARDVSPSPRAGRYPDIAPAASPSLY